MFAASKTNSVSTSNYEISRSLRFNQPDSTYLSRTPASASNRKTYTWSGWVKRSSIGTGDRRLFEAGVSSSNVFWFGFGNDSSTDQFLIQDYSGGFGIQLGTTALYRDVSAWYHVVVAIDTTQATSTDRVKLYINGVQVTSFSGTTTYPSQNYDTRVNQTVVHDLGGSTVIGGSAYYNGYITEVNFIDGTQLTPSSFGETNAQTGVWQPKAYSGSYGTNGFYLNFSDNSNTTAATLGKDYSGNGNNWTPNNFSVTAGVGNDSLVDSPTSYGIDTGAGGNVRGNYCTFNPLALNSSGLVTNSNGNLDVACNSSNAPCAIGTIAVNSGKWYWEITLTANYAYAGAATPEARDSVSYLGAVSGQFIYNVNTPSSSFIDGVVYDYTTASSCVLNDVVGVALDFDSNTVTFYKNGVSQGVFGSNFLVGRTWSPAFKSNTSSSATFNFGQRPFAYTAPSGFKALCTQNLPTPTIGATNATQAGKYFNSVIYTGNGTTQAVTGVGFQPDFTWIKDRNAGYDHQLFDVIRGALKTLQTDNTGAEVTYANSLTSWASDGFNLGGANGTNINGYNFVAWNWKANGSGVTNTAGSITSTVSANTTSGFSVVTYTGNGTVGATRGHGLGVAPSMIIVKGRSNVDNWHVYHSALGNTGGLFINSTSAFVTSSYFWNDTSPSSTVFTTSNGSSNNASGVTYVAYCFAEVAGYSKFGSYTGNGSADGPFVFTGMRPAFVMIKRTDDVGEWVMKDTTRSPYNTDGNTLLANRSDAEYGSGNTSIDELSNGFKCRTTSASANASGGTYIYMAFASNPFKTSLAR